MVRLHLKNVFIIVLSRGTLWHLQRFFQYIKYIILEFTPSTILTLFFHDNMNYIKTSGTTESDLVELDYTLTVTLPAI
jgi:hypothetical protein